MSQCKVTVQIQRGTGLKVNDVHSDIFYCLLDTGHDSPHAIDIGPVGIYMCHSCGWMSEPGGFIECDDPVNGPYYCPKCKAELL